MNEVATEIIEKWVMNSRPTKLRRHCVTAMQKLYDEYRDAQRTETDTPKHKNKEDLFSLKLKQVFDISIKQGAAVQVPTDVGKQNQPSHESGENLKFCRKTNTFV